MHDTSTRTASSTACAGASDSGFTCTQAGYYYCPLLAVKQQNTLSTVCSPALSRTKSHPQNAAPPRESNGALGQANPTFLSENV